MLRSLTLCLSLAFASLPPAAAADDDPGAFRVEAVQPADRQTDVEVGASFNLRFSQPVAVDSLDRLTLHRLGPVGAKGWEADGPAAEVPVARSTDLTNASITVAPTAFLLPNSLYELRATAELKSRDGAALRPFRARFRTEPQHKSFEGGLNFELERFETARSFTTILFGPDRRLYAADAFGTLLRWDLDEDGRPINKTTLRTDPRRSRQYIDLEWDPAATADSLILWASYGERLEPKGDRHYFTGTIARLDLGDGSMPNSIQERIIVAGLPHGREKQGGFETLPHQPNGLVFQEGRLYQSVGSTSSSGGPANWGIAEQPLSAGILEIDYQALLDADGPLDVRPSAGYDPDAADAPVRVFATGVRNALELVAHSNGRLYTAVNLNDRRGRGDGVPDDPDLPGDQNALVTQTTPEQESLLLIERGRYYGHPNPSRGQYILAGGNPTADEDPFEIPDYPVGTAPENGYAPELMYPIWRYGGTSPDGMIEYLPEGDHPLKGALLCCFYSAGDIAVMPLGAEGLPTGVKKLRRPEGKLRLTGPLDLTQDPATGVLYVAAFGTQNRFGEDGTLVLLRPRPER